MSDFTNNTVPEKSWLVLGPGRTGSICIVTFLSTILYEVYHNITNPDSSTINVAIPNGTIVHSHSLRTLDFITPTTEIILSIRNPVETSLSNAIKLQIGTTHLFKGDTAVPTIFYLDPDIFLHDYNRAVSFYKNIPSKIKRRAKTIDYSEFCNDVTNLSSLLGMFDPKVEENKKLYPGTCQRLEQKLDQKLPIKNPGSYAEWISNWSEIESLYQELKSEWAGI